MKSNLEVEGKLFPQKLPLFQGVANTLLLTRLQTFTRPLTVLRSWVSTKIHIIRRKRGVSPQERWLLKGMVFLHKWKIDCLIKYGRFQSTVSGMRNVRYRKRYSLLLVHFRRITKLRKVLLAS